MAMMPKRIKFRKAQRGRIRGDATRGNYVAFGEFGLQVVEAGWIKATQIEAGRRLYRHAATLRDAGEDYGMQAAQAKLFCTDAAMRVTIDAVQLHGGYGFVTEYPAERFMRDAKGLQIVEGTNQIQRHVIGRRLTKP